MLITISSVLINVCHYQPSCTSSSYSYSKEIYTGVVDSYLTRSADHDIVLLIVAASRQSWFSCLIRTGSSQLSLTAAAIKLRPEQSGLYQ